MKLPTVITSSVIRSADKGDSHGGVYLLDLEKEKYEQVIDWNTPEIDWSGRGGDRGLRGLANYKEKIYMAASDEIFIYDLNFRLLDSIKHPLLKHCHETFISGKRFFVTSTGFNALLEFDLDEDKFVGGYHVRFSRLAGLLYRYGLSVKPKFSQISAENLPELNLVGKDSLHINNVFVSNDVIYFSGTRIRHVFSVENKTLSIYANVPYSGHNARPYLDGILMNDTGAKNVAILDREGKYLRKHPLIIYPEKSLLKAELSKNVAQQGFARGLTVTGDGFLIAGSSPATISIFTPEQNMPLKSINISMDLRNAIHGLEIWPH